MLALVLEEYSRIRNPDVEAMCDLAMYNYIEVLVTVYMVLTTAGIPGKLLEFSNFFQGPGKLMQKEIIFQYSLKTPRISWKIFDFINNPKSAEEFKL